MIELKNVSICIKKNLVLKDVTITFTEGNCYGLIGRNGSGKSLLFKTLAGFIPLGAGEISVSQQDFTKNKKIVDAGVIIESPNFIANMSGFDNLLMLAQIKKIITNERIKEVLKLVGLGDSMDKKYKQYSLGMKQRLRIAQAIMEEPKYLILDEPFNGLDEQGVKDIHKVISKLQNKNKVILLTSHDNRDIEQLCNKIFQIEGGTIHEI